jgi:hypothetical protein
MSAILSGVIMSGMYPEGIKAFRVLLFQAIS